MVKDQELTEEKEMTFFEHLEELRKHLFRSAAAVAVFAIAAFVAKGFVFDTLIFGPTKSDFPTYKFLCKIAALTGVQNLCIQVDKFEIVNLDLSGQFMTHIKISVIVGFIAAFPYVFWEFWRFIRPGLKLNELKASRAVIGSGAVLFFVGVIFGYYVITPFSMSFFATYQITDAIKNTFSLESYISNLTMLVLATGIVFELPLVIFFLARMGIITANFMRHYRRHAVVIILILGAIITPPDVGSQILISVPLYALYEISIFVAAAVEKKEEQTEA